MPQVRHIKKARKSNRKFGIKKGKPYWTWGFRSGSGFVKKVSLVPPKRSQLTQSEFWSTVYSIQEQVDDEKVECPEDFNELLGDVRGQLEELRDDTQSKLDNMPESLQNGSSGELLQERIDKLDEVIDGLPDELSCEEMSDEDEDAREGADLGAEDALVDLRNKLDEIDCG